MKIKKSRWMPLTLFFVGCAFYIYYGITWNAWKQNLPNIIIYGIIVLALWWVLKKKEKMLDKRNSTTKQ